MVKYKTIGGEDEGSEVDETFDAVVVCSGHCTEPRIANDIPGIDLWPGRQIHSHNYHIHGPYQNQVVVLIGFSASAFDISRDIAGFAKEVHITTRSEKVEGFGKNPVYDSMWLHPMKEPMKMVEYHFEMKVRYKYHFPFLHTGGVVNVDDNCVGPLYKHVFPPTLALGLSFIGIPSFKVDSRCFIWLHSLPSEENMMEDTEALSSELEAKGVPRHHTHNIHGFEDWLAAQSGSPAIEEWRKGMLFRMISRVLNLPGTYRDVFDDEDLVTQAYEDFM
ncbi:Flavin-containing monooxygenase FMO GS-OX5 [Bienertia sinuspersici]